MYKNILCDCFACLPMMMRYWRIAWKCCWVYNFVSLSSATHPYPSKAAVKSNRLQLAPCVQCLCSLVASVRECVCMRPCLYVYVCVYVCDLVKERGCVRKLYFVYIISFLILCHIYNTLHDVAQSFRILKSYTRRNSSSIRRLSYTFLFYFFFRIIFGCIHPIYCVKCCTESRKKKKWKETAAAATVARSIKRVRKYI